MFLLVTRIRGYKIIGFSGQFFSLLGYLFFCIDVAMSDLVHDVESIFHLHSTQLIFIFFLIKANIERLYTKDVNECSNIFILSPRCASSKFSKEEL